eukprot:EC791635.1.p3 GENE.EC791635.1~~EC791635.1.p3  ORF type:complete len:145 (+),score=33.57 EC791635.1:142-576(+)
MEARHLTRHSSSVTYWEGEIIDNINYFFLTNRWRADFETDRKHWERFAAFAPFHKDFVSIGCDCIPIASRSQYKFMRWKEQCFLKTDSECSLTISGFYYMCYDTASGHIEGYYCDPELRPFQGVQLDLVPGGSSGYSFGEFEFA